MRKVRGIASASMRAAGLGFWLAAGVAIVACIYPLSSPNRRLTLKRRWSRGLLRVLGVELRQTAHPECGLLVANHVSWVDIFAINAVCPAAFIAKSDVRAWPVIGWLCTRTDTLFIRRDSLRHAQAVGQEAGRRLKAGETLAVFPEGTSTPGGEVLRFNAALFQPAIDAGVPVQPAAIRYHECGMPTDAASYAGDMSLGRSIWTILRSQRLAVTIDWLPLLESCGRHRRDLAFEAESLIRSIVADGGRVVHPASAPPSALIEACAASAGATPAS